MSEPIRTMSNDETNVISFEVPTPFPVGPVNLYLIIGEKLTLVDTGPKTELAWKSFIYQLNKNGFRIKDIDQVVLTHHHVDHSGLLSVFNEQYPKIKVFAHPETIPWVEHRNTVVDEMIDFYADLYQKNGMTTNIIESIKKFHQYFNQYIGTVRVDETLAEGDFLNGNRGWEVIHNPGHAQGHISLYHKESSVLISGDHLIENVSSGTFIEPPSDKSQPRPRSLVDYKNSLEKLQKMKIKSVYSGHGNIITKPMEVIENHLLKIEQRSSHLKSVLKQPMSVFEVLKAAYPSTYHKNIPMFFSEVLGSLDLLEGKGVVSTKYEDGVYHYYLK